ncbi:monooxygenase fad-binding protein [Moniliophthora roreri MCA 2997]|uniref:Monooxygenase fad-binding protein n=1 Tax=Moniliophthora roreri (strain MCA 2997) TaxID=1381753 RepID=V2X7E4_MONRO|nr:monooxygenase fad-binding protein [Moniliophthora roreri MCA 2997]
MSLPTRTKYLVVGAGPAGLGTAVSLVKHGANSQDVVVVDRSLQGENSSRAMVVHAASLEALDSVGCAEDLVRRGTKGVKLRLQDRSASPILRVDFSCLSSYTRFPYFLVVPQTITEQVLEDHVQALGIRIFRPFTAVGMKASASGQGSLDVSFESGEVVTAEVVVGADGSKSVIRQLAGIEFRDPEGRLYADSPGELIQSAIADATFAEKPEVFEEGTLWATISSKGFNALVPFTPDSSSSLYKTDKPTYRVIFALPTSADPPPSQLPKEVLQQYINDYGPFQLSSDPFTNTHPIKLSDVYWSSRFRHRSAAADTFFKRLGGVVFLVGDAAHVHSPAGGQGMNLGLRDAISLGGVLAQHIDKPDIELDGILEQHGKLRRERAIKTIGLTKNMVGGAIAIMSSGIYYWGLKLLGFIPAIRNAFVWRLSGLGNR